MFHHDIDGPVLPVAQCDIGIEKVEAAENGDISNMSVDEYLTWVQRQASELPGVVRVDVPTEASTKDEDYPTACEATDRNVPEKNIKDILEYTGNDVWKRCMLQEFEEFREVGLAVISSLSAYVLTMVWCFLMCLFIELWSATPPTEAGTSSPPQR